MLLKNNVLAALVLSCTMCMVQSQEIGEKGFHSSVTFTCGDKVVSAYYDGVDVTEEYISGEKHLEEKIEEYMGEDAFADVVNIRFCHFSDNFYNMTAEFSYQGCEYCVAMFDWKVSGLEKILISEDGKDPE